jgi:hypothetical protein
MGVSAILTSGACSRKAAMRASCSRVSGVSVAWPDAKGIGSTSMRSMRESALNRTRPIQLTGAAMAFTAMFRIVLQMASLKSKRGSLSRPLTGRVTRMSPRESFMSETSIPRGNPIRACA